LLGIVGELGIRNYELGRSNPPSNKPTNYKSPSLLLVWWIVLFLPALLAPEGAPHHLRLLGTIVPTYALTAVGVILSTNFLTRLLSQLPITNYQLPISNLQSLISNSLPLFLYAALALHTFNNTFIRWPVSTDFTLPFDLYATRLAAAIAQAPPDTAYVLPMDIRAADEARHYTLDYLLSDRPDAAYSYIPVDEA
ncbi:MAG: hypothetical protein KDJ65_40610, partial [Anaerolineae bacterium]|nr:hypothetical protein [Anaerolineae bacterium]